MIPIVAINHSRIGAVTIKPVRKSVPIREPSRGIVIDHACPIVSLFPIISCETAAARTPTRIVVPTNVASVRTPLPPSIVRSCMTSASLLLVAAWGSEKPVVD